MSIDEKALATAGDVCQRLQNVLRENLVSCTLYGSAVRGDMVPGRSDINLLIVLDHSSPEAHRAIAEEVRPFPSVTPFVLSRWELPRSRPVFALKFLSIGRNHKVLCGEDPIAGFAPSPGLLRLLCEQSLRNLRLRLKHAYIRHAHKPDRYGQVLLQYAPSLFVSLSEVLRCANIDIPADHASRAEAIGRALKTDGTVLNDLREFRQRPRRLSTSQAFEFHARLFRLLSAALDWVREQWPQCPEIQ